MFLVFNKKKIISLLVGVVVLCISFITITQNNILETSGELNTYRIVVDAGHGEPDGGAVSANGIAEQSLNLTIATKLQNALEDEGFDVIMTRADENNIADSDKQGSLKEMKSSDLTNRVKIANSSGADFMVSIHMNKYGNSKYWGWQTFYSKNSENGKRLADLIQSSISENINKDNKRTALSIEGIKIVDKTNIPVVIVECGFLSNPEELELLQNEDYQEKLVKGICMGITKYYN